LLADERNSQSARRDCFLSGKGCVKDLGFEMRLLFGGHGKPLPDSQMRPKAAQRESTREAENLRSATVLRNAKAEENESRSVFLWRGLQNRLKMSL
jgi:hypothetical protein